MAAPKRKWTILFVDDERDILDGLRVTLRRERYRWNLRFAHGGQEALRELDERSVDVIVSDMQMPGMDGAELLGLVRDQFPTTVRVVLSGHADERTALKAVPLAHQWLPKPSSREILVNSIDCACRVRELVSNSDIERIVGRVSKLPSLSRTYNTLLELLSNSDSSVDEIAEIVQQDPAMCARFLQIANSAFFGLPRTIVEVSEAVTFLGFRMVNRLVLAAELFEMLPESSYPPGFSMAAFQQHSLLTSRLAPTLLSDCSESIDGTATAGMLHDIGTLVLLRHSPQGFRRAREFAVNENMPVWQAEQAVLGTTHATIGAALLGMWGLPIEVVDGVAQHHSVDALPKDQLGIAGALHLSEALIDEVLCQTPIDARTLEHVRALGLEDHLKGWRVAVRCLTQYIHDSEAA